MRKFTRAAWLLASMAGVVSVGAEIVRAQGAAPPGRPNGKTIVFIAGSSNNTSKPGESIGEKFLIERLTTQGFTVTVMADNTAKEEMLAKVNAASLVMVGESTTSGQLTDKLYATPTTMFSMEAMIQDDMGMTGKSRSCDPGVPPNCQYGVKDKVTELDIVDATHPLAAGLSGTVKVYKEPKEMDWGMVGGQVHVVATLAGDKTGASLYFYKKGDTLVDGSKAAGTRLMFFIEDDNTTGTPNLMTPEGMKLFDTAVTWALGN